MLQHSKTAADTVSEEPWVRRPKTSIDVSDDNNANASFVAETPTRRVAGAPGVSQSSPWSSANIWRRALPVNPIVS
jgi:hypothetical protein